MFYFSLGTLIRPVYNTTFELLKLALEYSAFISFLKPQFVFGGSIWTCSREPNNNVLSASSDPLKFAVWLLIAAWTRANIVQFHTMPPSSVHIFSCFYFLTTDKQVSPKSGTLKSPPKGFDTSVISKTYYNLVRKPRYLLFVSLNHIYCLISWCWS